MSMKAIRKHLKKQQTKPDPEGREFISTGAVAGFVGGVFVPMYFFGAGYAEAFFVGVVAALIVAFVALWLVDKFATKSEESADRDRDDSQTSKQDTID